MSEPSLLAVLGRVATLCEQCHLRYMIMGGVAVAVHAVPRPTLDIDLTLEAGDEALDEFLGAAVEADFVVPDRYRAGFADELMGMRKLQLSAFEGDLEHDVDCFLVTTPYQAAAIERRQSATLGGHAIWVMAPEDLILHKLLTGRGRDESDVDDLLFLQGRLDLDYMRKWAANLDVLSVLERKLDQMDEGMRA